jgi:pSer/pThr/pTyr-binding forkhead associated (FHA) protein
MRARLLCRTGELAGADFEITDEATIGRTATNSIVLPAGVVSQAHAHLFVDPETQHYVIEDLQSRNGTRVDGVPVTEQMRLGPLHVITFGERHDFIFQELNTPAGSSTRLRPEQLTAVALEPVLPAQPDLSRKLAASVGTETLAGSAGVFRVPAGLGEPVTPAARAEDDESTRTRVGPGGAFQLPKGLGEKTGAGEDVSATRTSLQANVSLQMPEALQQGSPFLIEIDDEQGRRSIGLVEGRQVAGRSPECRICLASRTLSREHAAIAVEGERVIVTDLGTANGTFVDGVRLTAPTDVRPGARITLGDRTRLTLGRVGGKA